MLPVCDVTVPGTVDNDDDDDWDLALGVGGCDCHHRGAVVVTIREIT